MSEAQLSRRLYPQAIAQQAPGVWGAINDHPHHRRLLVVRFIVVLERESPPKSAFIRKALVGAPPERPLLGEGYACPPIPAELFQPPHVVGLLPPFARWEPGECLLVLTEGPVEAMAVLCALSDSEKEARP